MISARNFWDKAAPRYAKMPIRDTESYEYTLARTRSYLSQADIALEVGCGTGGTARKLAPHLTHITGTDIAPAMIRIARERCGEEGVANAAFEAADIAGSPVGPFDAVLAHNVLHLVPETEAAIGALHNRVRPGGLFISKTPCLGNNGISLKIRLMLKVLPLLQMVGKAPAVRFLSVDELETMITQAGFEIVESGSYPANPPSRYIVARRIA